MINQEKPAKPALTAEQSARIRSAFGELLPEPTPRVRKRRHTYKTSPPDGLSEALYEVHRAWWTREGTPVSVHPDWEQLEEHAREFYRWLAAGVRHHFGEARP